MFKFKIISLYNTWLITHFLHNQIFIIIYTVLMYAFTLYTVHFTLYGIRCTLYIVDYTLYNIIYSTVYHDI